MGAGSNLIRPLKEKTIRAVARVQKKSGVPVMTHTTMGTMALEQLDLLEEEGADLSRVAVSHMGRNLDYQMHEKIVKRGAWLSYDGPSKIKYAPDSARIELLNRLIDAGFQEKILISGDMGRRTYLRGYGGGPGFEFVPKKFTPRLKEEGRDQDLIDQIFICNPAAYLSYR